MREKEKVCGTCKWNKYKRIAGTLNYDFACVNPDGEYCGYFMDYSCTCDEWEEKA